MSWELAYANGEWKPIASTSLQIDDWGVIQGVIAVERLRTYGGRLLFLDRYQQRLRDTLQHLGIEDEKLVMEFPSICNSLVQRNGVPSDGSTDAGLVVLVTPGRPHLGPTCIAHLVPLPWERIHRLYTEGQSLRISEVEQVPIECWPRYLKVRSRLHYYLADRQVQSVEPNAEALLCDHDGCVTETSTGNLILVEGDGYFVPPWERVLPGITLHRTMETISRLGYPLKHEPIHGHRLKSAQEIIMTGTTAGVWSVTQVDGHAVSDGQTGHRCRQLQSIWFDEIGINLENQARQQLNK